MRHETIGTIGALLTGLLLSACATVTGPVNAAEAETAGEMDVVTEYDITQLAITIMHDEGGTPVTVIREFELGDGTRCVTSSNRFSNGRGAAFGGGIDCDWSSTGPADRAAG